MLGSIGVSFDKWLPYASGCLIAHCSKAHPEIEFLEPMYKALSVAKFTRRTHEVDLLGLTVYTWNQNLCELYSKNFKLQNPKGIVVWGGPNIPKEDEAFSSYKKKYSYVDIFVTGMGEEAFSSILFDLKNTPLPPMEQKLVQHSGRLFPLESQHSNPYLDGIFESILQTDSNLKASFETNRGCPYRCSFCDWGGQSNSRIYKVDPEVVEKTIDYIFSRPSIKEIEILDANFGMFKDDLETIEKMVEAKRKYGTNPNVSYSGLAKNGSKYLPKILKLLSDEFDMNKRHLKLSFQSHSTNTLGINLRENIKNEKLLAVVDELPKVSLSSELIIGLPGDTPSSFLETLSKDIEIGIDQSRAYILSATENTAIRSKDFAKEHGVKFKSINFPINFREINRKEYLDTEQTNAPIIDDELYEQHHVVYECNSYSNEGLKKIYTYWWFHHNFYNAQTIAGLIKYLHANGYPYQTWIDDFIAFSSSKELLAAQIAKINNFVEKYFSPEIETTIADYSIYLFASGAMRTNELVMFSRNQNSFKNYLRDFFGSDIFSKIDTQVAMHLENDLEAWTKSPDNPNSLVKLIGLNATI